MLRRSENSFNPVTPRAARAPLFFELAGFEKVKKYCRNKNCASEQKLRFCLQLDIRLYAVLMAAQAFYSLKNAGITIIVNFIAKKSR